MSSFGGDAPLWVDTDAGFDDLVALGALAGLARLRLVTVGSGACETPAVGAERVSRFLAVLGRADVDVVAGSAAASVTAVPWLTEARRKMVDWCDAELPTGGEVASPRSGTAATDAVLGLGAPADAICLGPLGNVAACLRRGAPLRSCTVMGGNRLETGGDDGAEFNFACDPAAAAEVVSRAPRLTIVGLDACDGDAGAADLATRPGLVASLVATDAYAVVCDPVAAFVAVGGADVCVARATPASVDAATGVLSPHGGSRPVRVATSLKDRDAYIAWLAAACEDRGRSPGPAPR